MSFREGIRKGRKEKGLDKGRVEKRVGNAGNEKGWEGVERFNVE